MDGQHLRLNIPNPWPKKATKEPARKSAKPPAFFRTKRPKRLWRSKRFKKKRHACLSCSGRTAARAMRGLFLGSFPLLPLLPYLLPRAPWFIPATVMNVVRCMSLLLFPVHMPNPEIVTLHFPLRESMLQVGTYSLSYSYYLSLIVKSQIR